MELWTAFLLGLVGSLHCAGMCGPIALAIPSNVKSTSRFLLDRFAYNFGRVSTYCLLGVLLGLVGKSFTLFGVQRWVSLTTGVLILVALIVGSKISIAARVAQPVAVLKNLLAKFLRAPSLTSSFMLGLLNGFLPCGLVYAACAGAIATSGFVSSVSYMAMFGAGTIPMMLGIALAGKKLQFTLRFKLQKLIPITLIVLSALLIFRGLGLGIPYLSPVTPGSCCKR